MAPRLSLLRTIFLVLILFTLIAFIVLNVLHQSIDTHDDHRGGLRSSSSTSSSSSMIVRETPHNDPANTNSPPMPPAPLAPPPLGLGLPYALSDEAPPPPPPTPPPPLDPDLPIYTPHNAPPSPYTPGHNLTCLSLSPEAVQPRCNVNPLVLHQRKPYIKYEPPRHPITSRWGNALSPYWQVRAVAEIGGWGFFTTMGVNQKDFEDAEGRYHVQGEVSHTEQFFRYLPHSVEPTHCWDEQAFYLACKCDAIRRSSKHMHFAHSCPHGWSDIVPTIQKETRAAIEEFERQNDFHSKDNWHVEGGVKAAREAEATWEQSWLIWARCVPGRNEIHGLNGMSLLNELDSFGPVAPTTFYIAGFESDAEQDVPFCSWWKDAISAKLVAKFPGATVQVVSHGSRVSDFVTLSLAPNVAVMSSGSTWSLWGVLANYGNVLIGNIMPGCEHETRGCATFGERGGKEQVVSFPSFSAGNLPDNFRARTNTPVLLPSHGKWNFVDLGINAPPVNESDYDMIKQWVLAN